MNFFQISSCEQIRQKVFLAMRKSSLPTNFQLNILIFEDKISLQVQSLKKKDRKSAQVGNLSKKGQPSSRCQLQIPTQSISDVLHSVNATFIKILKIHHFSYSNMAKNITQKRTHSIQNISHNYFVHWCHSGCFASLSIQKFYWQPFGKIHNRGLLGSW